MSRADGDPRPTVLVIPHTHWDREWYHTAGRFRQRLVALVDELIDARPDTLRDATADARPDASSGGEGEHVENAPFLLDGQAIVLDDYLAVRPERQGALAAALARGTLEAGPWYVLADALLPGAESLVRNLLAGRRTLGRLGATPPPVLYAPDSFGHPAAHPMLARGFGFDVAIVWRGYGGARWPEGDAAWWCAPDGSRVLLVHLPPDGYEVGSRLPPALPAARERWGELAAVLLPRARLDVVLLPNGADHHARQERWGEAVEALRRAADPVPIEVASLREFAVRAHAAAERVSLAPVAGELRDSYGYTWTLQGTFASRASLKRRAARAERALVRDVEPWTALATLGAPRARDGQRALLDAAWSDLLRCHPHDTLCGCSIDAVARAMAARLDEVESQIAGLRHEALDVLTNHDPVRARGLRTLWRPEVLVRNRAARARGGVAEVRIDSFVRDVAVGPGSARRWQPVRAPATPVALTGSDSDAPLPIQVLSRTLEHDRVESPRHYPDDDLVERARAVVWIAPVPGHGVAGLALATPEHTARAAEPPSSVRAHDGRLENAHLRIAVDARGRVSLDELDGAGATATTVEDLVGFEDVGDAGDLYTHSPVGQPLVTARCLGVRTLDRGPLRATIEARYELRVPEALARDPDDPFSRPRRRGGRAVDLPITLRFTLDAGAPFVRMRVTGNNRARDHRLRLVVRTGITSPRVLADAAFGPVERAAGALETDDTRMERPVATAPLHRYVTRSDATRGVTVFADGLAEYEALADGGIAVSLVRAVGELSRPDLPERPGHAGWPSSTPEAQCLGPFAGEFAVALHGPDGVAMRTRVAELADDVLLPLTGETNRAALHPLVARACLELTGADLAFSTAKPAERGDGWVALRALNLSEEARSGTWRVRTVGAAVQTACRARLDETLGEPLPVASDADGMALVRFMCAPREAITILVR